MPYRHEVFFYASQTELLDANLQWLRDGLEAGDVIALGCGVGSNARLAAALEHHPGLRLLPEGGVYDKAVDAVSFYHDLVTETAAREHAGVRALAEVGFSTDASGREEWRRYEAVCNHALAPLPLWSVCAYRTPDLPQVLLDTARSTHPWLRTAQGTEPNGDYVPPAQLLDGADRPLPTPAGAATTVTLTHTGDLAELRHWLRGGLERFDDLTPVADVVVLAVNEVAVNGLQHGSPPVEVTLWRTPDHIICDVTDHGPGISTPLVGYTPPDPTRPAEHGVGLWMTRRLCDEVVIGRSSGSSTIRLAVRCSAG